MIATNCPICEESRVLSKPATIANFLVERCLFAEHETKSLFCVKCQFVFFERRLSDYESKLLYEGYRDEEYTRHRLAVEPSYKLHQEMFENVFSEYYRNRTNEILDVLRENALMLAKDVLDFGGDGMIPSQLSPSAIIDIDDPAHKSASANQKLYDLIFASEVFEHLSEPRIYLNRLKKKLKPSGTIVIDVPLEYVGAIKQEWDLQAVFGGPLMNMHEHLNHFSVEALHELAKMCDLTVKTWRISPSNFLIFVLAE